jgi:hypothetical protein
MCCRLRDRAALGDGSSIAHGAQLVNPQVARWVRLGSFRR